MTTFNTDGFLSDEVAEIETAIAGKYAEKLDLARDANRAAHRLIEIVEMRPVLPDLLLVTLLGRQAASFQGFVILLQKGLLMQAQILLRNVAESMFIIGAIGKDETFAEAYVRADEVTRRKSLEALVRDMDRRAAGEDVDEETKQLIASLKEETQDVKTFKTERIAQIAELQTYYDNLYRLTSMAVHTSTRSLDGALETDEKGNVKAVIYEPILDKLDMYLDYGISMLLYSLHEIGSHFGLEVEEIEVLQETNNQLAGPNSENAE